MSKLSNFSIETDQMVLLQFKNGQEQRVPVSQLAQHLTGSDLSRVSEALKLRRDFIRTHMPKAGLMMMLATGAIAALVVTQGARVATQILQRGMLAPAPAHDTVIAEPLPAGSPAATPGSTGGTPSDISRPVQPAPTLRPQFRLESNSGSTKHKQVPAPNRLLPHIAPGLFHADPPGQSKLPVSLLPVVPAPSRESEPGAKSLHDPGEPPFAKQH